MHTENFILLAEDDEDDQELIQIALKRVASDHVVRIVSNGQELLNVLAGEKHLPCLIILDLNMPLVDGIQTLRVLGHDPKYAHIPKVILTTSDSENNKNISYFYGALDYFVKPSSMKELVTTAEKILTYCH